MEEIKICRYYIAVRWIEKKLSYIESAILLNKIFMELSNSDPLFEEINLITNPGKANIKLFFSTNSSSLTDNEFAGILFKRDKYWIKKIIPNTPLNIENRDYPIHGSFTLKGKPLEHISISFSAGNIGFNQFRIDFPRGFIRDFEWYKQILVSTINNFKPDYGGLYPIIIQKTGHPAITAGWLSYFSKDLNVNDEIWSNCIKIPLAGNKFIYALEDNHMILDNSGQFQKLTDIVNIFKELGNEYFSKNNKI